MAWEITPNYIAVAAGFASVAACFWLDFRHADRAARWAAHALAGAVLLGWGGLACPGVVWPWLLAVILAGGAWNFSEGKRRRERPGGWRIDRDPQRWRLSELWLLGWLALILFQSAWVGDDAFISFRTADNFCRGLGLRWNPAERVQTFTHPLWLFLLAGGKWLGRDLYGTSLFLGLAFSLVSARILAGKLAENPTAAFFSFLALGLSKAWVDYGTSGLENSLTYALVALFVWQAAEDPGDLKHFFKLSLLAGLAGFNRLDILLLVGPWLGRCAWERSRMYGARVIWAGLAGLGPVWGWEVFSCGYYGFPFPNTAYAKLLSGIPREALLGQGVAYLAQAWLLDPLTLLVIAAGVILPFWKRRTDWMPLAAGLAAYLAYVVWIGGDFMGGRFLAAPFVAALGMTLRLLSWPEKRLAWILLAGIGLGMLVSRSPWNSGLDYPPRPVRDYRGVADERANYYPALGWLRRPFDGGSLPHPWMAKGNMLKRQGNLVTLERAVGMIGYYAGPRVHIVDILGLGDPLLARLPCGPAAWVMGHFQRVVPEGYLDTLRTGRNCFQDPELARYYEKLARLTRGDLWDPRRWLEMIRLNTGAYQGWIHAERYRRPSSRPERERALQSAPGDDEYARWVARGMSAAFENKWEAAAACWQRAIQLQPERPQAQGNLGVFYEMRGRGDLAYWQYRLAARGGDGPWAQYAETVKRMLNGPAYFPSAP